MYGNEGGMCMCMRGKCMGMRGMCMGMRGMYEGMGIYAQERGVRVRGGHAYGNEGYVWE